MGYLRIKQGIKSLQETEGPWGSAHDACQRVVTVHVKCLSLRSISHGLNDSNSKRLICLLFPLGL